MSSERQAAIREDLVEAQRALIAVLDLVGPEDWSRPTPNEGWTVRDLLVHLTTSESGFVPTLRRMAAGEGGVPSDFDPNRWNAGQLRRRATTSVDELQPEMEAAHLAMLRLLDELDDAALDQRGYISSGANGSVEDAFRLVASHKRGHTSDLRAAMGSPARN